MRLMIATAAIVAALSSSAKAAADANQLKDCSDRNALNSIAVDARLVAIKFYYDGFIHGITDRNRQTCYEARVLNDERLAIVNKTLDLIERDCLPIETAARLALEGACPVGRFSIKPTRLVIATRGPDPWGSNPGAAAPVLRSPDCFAARSVFRSR